MRVSESPDAQAVGGVQLAEEELTAGIPHPIELQQAGCWEQCLGRVQFKVNSSVPSTCSVMKSLTRVTCLKIQNFLPYLHVAFPDHYLCCVGVLDQLLQSLRVDVMQGDVGLSTL